MKGHEDPSQFEEADMIIKKKIVDLNGFLKWKCLAHAYLSEDLNKNTKTRKAILGIFKI